jgi:Fe(II)/alpha-ketoglutarate-dependent arginine beta-hydroxylase
MPGPSARGVAEYELRAAERREIDALLERLIDDHGSAESPAFLTDARRLGFAHLPTGLARFLDRFQRSEFAPAVAVVGLEVDDAAIGPTPAHWRAQPDPGSTLREELFFVLLGALLGDVFGWATLQDGRLVHNVIPIQSQEQEQSGHGSHAPLAWHTEDGFHPFRCDYLGLMSLRNVDRIPTTMSSIDDVELSPEHRRLLMRPRYVIRPDNEHLVQRAREGDSLADVPRDWVDPAPTAVLFGDPERPYLRIDPIFMSVAPGDDEAEAALAAIVGQLEEHLVDVALDQGTVCFIDNYRAVHGRQSFRPRYDGTDRWLKKTVLTRDLRKSRAARARPEARTLQPTVLSGAVR